MINKAKSVNKATLSGTLTQSCGCIIDLDVLASTENSNVITRTVDILRGKKPYYIQYCGGSDVNPKHRDIDEVLGK